MAIRIVSQPKYRDTCAIVNILLHCVLHAKLIGHTCVPLLHSVLSTETVTCENTTVLQHVRKGLKPVSVTLGI